MVSGVKVVIEDDVFGVDVHTIYILPALRTSSNTKTNKQTNNKHQRGYHSKLEKNAGKIIRA